MLTYYISTNPEYYGSDATQEEANAYAGIIAARAAEAFPDVNFQIISGSEGRQDVEDEDLLAEIQQTINDNWADWIA